MALKQDNPGCNCCGADCAPCTSGEAPSTYTVEIAGMTNDGCGSCGDYNGSYILDHDASDTTVNTCYWRYSQSSAPCVSDPNESLQVQLAINWGAGDFLQVAVEEYIGGTKQWGVEFLASLASQPDCDALDDTDLPYDTQSITFPCDASGATCTLNPI